MVGQTQELAFYYPGHLWRYGDWVKNLLLFFDGIALLVPEYKLHEVEVMDPVIAAPLAEAGLLHILPADTTVDKATTTQLADAMEPILTSGALDHLEETEFHSLSLSRMGWYGAQNVADSLLQKLEKRKLARRSEDGYSIPIHPLVRVLILTLLSQIIRAGALKKGRDLSPATDRWELVDALNDLLRAGKPVTSADVVAFDLETVGVDLSGVPMNEVLDFRAKNLTQHRAYARSIREFIREIHDIPTADRAKTFEDRQSEIRDLAADLKTVARQAWKRPAAFALTIAGTAAGFGSGGLAAGVLGILGAIAGYEKPAAPVSAYSYLFNSAKYLR
jgi:hypothetical protein